MNTIDVHVHLSAPPQGTTYTVTHSDGTVTTITASAAPADAAVTSPKSAAPALPVEVEKVVVRHEKNGVKGTRSRDLVHALSQRGWTPKAGPKYIRFIYEGEGSKVTLYSNSRDLIARDNEMYAKKLPGAEMTASGVRFNYIADFDNAVHAAESMKAITTLEGKSSKP